MISVYIRSERLSPSSYYRIIQYTNVINAEYRINQLFTYSIYHFFLSSKDKWYFLFLKVYCFIVAYFHTFYFLCRDCINIPDRVVVSREIMPHFLFFPLDVMLKYLSKHSYLIWDFDDNILYGKEISSKEFKLLSKYSQSIIVTSEFLKNTISKKYVAKVELMPTTDGDLQKYNISEVIRDRILNFNSEIILIWIGTAANLQFISCVIPILEEIAHWLWKTLNKELTLNIVSSSFPIYSSRYLRINTIEWSRDIAESELKKAHIGIMPLKDSLYAKGKGAFKLIQYMSIGLPVIGSKVGYNKDVIDSTLGFLIEDIYDLSAWKEAIIAITRNKEVYCKYCNASYDRWKRDFSYGNNLRRWRELLNV